eukprot:1139421-Pelagomonas_calceolata.AAC.10
MNLTQLYTKKKKAGWSFNDIMHNAICSEQRWSPFLLTLNAWIPERTQDCAVLVGPCALGEGSALFCLRWHQVQGTSQSSGALVPVLATATLQEMDCNATSSELPIQEMIEAKSVVHALTATKQGALFGRVIQMAWNGATAATAAAAAATAGKAIAAAAAAATATAATAAVASAVQHIAHSLRHSRLSSAHAVNASPGIRTDIMPVWNQVVGCALANLGQRNRSGNLFVALQLKFLI